MGGLNPLSYPEEFLSVSAPLKLPTIADVTLRAVGVPLPYPLATRVGRFDHWPLLLIDLHSEEGAVGRAYLAPYLRTALTAAASVLQDLVEGLRGHHVAPVSLHDLARSRLALLGHQGVSTMAIAGLDMACWDLLARHAELPLAVLLGGTLAPVRAYNSNGLGLMDPDATAPEARALVAEGAFDTLKVRVGRDRPADDLAALEAVRAAVGPEVRLLCDFNQGLSLDQALERCRALDAHDLLWIEEPIAYDNLAANAHLARDTRTPISLGENFYGPRAMLEALRAGACDLVMPDAMRIGGVTGWLRAAGLADAWGVPMSSHLYPEISAHLLRVTPPRTCSSGKAGRTPSSPTPSPSATATSTPTTRRASASTGTRPPSSAIASTSISISSHSLRSAAFCDGRRRGALERPGPVQCPCSNQGLSTAPLGNRETLPSRRSIPCLGAGARASRMPISVSADKTSRESARRENPGLECDGSPRNSSSSRTAAWRATGT